MRAPHGTTLWAGSIVYLISLLGTLLLANERARRWAVLLFIAAAVMAVLLWGHQRWIPAFGPDVTSRSGDANGRRSFYFLGVLTALVLVLAADLRYAAAPNTTFGFAGILWLAGIGLLLCAAFVGS